jgi:hypothetical protein
LATFLNLMRMDHDFHEYYPDSVTMALSGFRPSHVPSSQYVLARRRCPIYPLEDPHWISVTSRKVSVACAPQHTEKCHRLQANFPMGVVFHPWRLGFGESTSHHIVRVSQGFLATTLSPHLALRACDCSLCLSAPGQPLTQRTSFQFFPFQTGYGDA